MALTLPSGEAAFLQAARRPAISWVAADARLCAGGYGADATANFKAGADTRGGYHVPDQWSRRVTGTWMGERPFEILDGWFAGTRDDLCLRNAIVPALESAAPKSETYGEVGSVLCSPGILGGWSSLASVPGIGALPYPEVQLDPHLYNTQPDVISGKKPSVRKKLRPDEIKRADYLLEVMLPNIVPCSFDINRFSSSGAPYYTTDVTVKADMSLWLLDKGALESFFSLIRKGDWRGLYHKYRVLNVLTPGTRHQTDPRSKIRDVYNDGRWQQADRSLVGRLGVERGLKHLAVDRDDSEWVEASEFCLADRARLFLVIPWANQVIMSPVCDGIRNGGYSRLPPKQADTPAQIQTFIDRWARIYGPSMIVCTTDLTTHDQLIPGDFIDAYARRAGALSRPEMATYISAMARAACLELPNQTRKEYGLVGDPFDPFSREISQNLSGWKPTSEIANTAAAFYHTEIMREARLIASGGDAWRYDIGRCIAGEGPVPWLQLGDNLTMVFKDRRTHDVYWNAVAQFELNRPSLSGTIAGQVLVRSDVKKSIEVRPNIVSYPSKLLNPPRSLRDPQRGNPLMGLGARRSIYRVSDAFDDVYDVTRSYVYRHIGFDIDQAAKEPVGTDTINYYELLLKSDPDYRHYRVARSQVSEQAWAELTFSVPQDLFIEALTAAQVWR
jgi:hypothetical protein